MQNKEGLKVKDLGKDKIEISGNQKVVMAITLAVQKKDVKINEGNFDTQTTPDVGGTRMSYLKLKMVMQLLKKKLTFKKMVTQMLHLQFVSARL